MAVEKTPRHLLFDTLELFRTEAGMDEATLATIVAETEADRAEAVVRVQDGFDSNLPQVAVDILKRYQSRLSREELEDFTSRLGEGIRASLSKKSRRPSTNYELISTLWMISVDVLDWLKQKARDKQEDLETRIDVDLEEVWQPLDEVFQRLEEKKNKVLRELRTKEDDSLTVAFAEDGGEKEESQRRERRRRKKDAHEVALRAIRDAKHLGLNRKNCPALRLSEEKLMERAVKKGAQRFLEILPSMTVVVVDKFLLVQPEPPFGPEEMKEVDGRLGEMRRAEEAAATNLASAIRLRNVAYLKETIAACRKLGHTGANLKRAEKVRWFRTA